MNVFLKIRLMSAVFNSRNSPLKGVVADRVQIIRQLIELQLRALITNQAPSGFYTFISSVAA
jgi:hypothetical protein